MQKFTRLALGLLLAGSLATPLFAIADDGIPVGEYCGDSTADCVTGSSCDLVTKTCVANTGTSGQALLHANGSACDFENDNGVQPGIWQNDSCVLSSGSAGNTGSTGGSILVGGDCTANPNGCAAGLYCVPGDYGSVCVNSPTGSTGGGTITLPGGSAGGTTVTGTGPGGITVPSGTGALNLNYIQGYATSIIYVINFILVPVLMAIAFIVFIWSVYRYFILGASNESEKGEGRKFAMWSVIGFVIILSLWGLVNIVQSTILPSGVNNTHPAYPKL